MTTMGQRTGSQRKGIKMKVKREVGKFYAKTAEQKNDAWETVSIGVRQATSNRALAAASVRITGYNTEVGVDEINHLAVLVAAKLNDGSYDGPKNLHTNSDYAKRLMSV